MAVREMSVKGLMFFILAFSALALPIIISFYKYYYAKDYNYLVEAKCDPSIERCFSRDCSNPDDCPPNGLSIYKEYYVKAYDFPKCRDNSCRYECTKRIINCIPIPCGESPEDVCTKPPR
jgi:hypothetical protein